jgi:hypothetical protein
MVSQWEILKSNDQRTTYRHTTHIKHQSEDKNLSVSVWRKCSMIITLSVYYAFTLSLCAFIAFWQKYSFM